MRITAKQKASVPVQRAVRQVAGHLWYDRRASELREAYGQLCARASEPREAQAESRSTVCSRDRKLAVVRSPFDNVRLDTIALSTMMNWEWQHVRTPTTSPQWNVVVLCTCATWHIGG